MQKITPFLWFDGNLEAALQFYTAIFKNSLVHHMSRMPDGPDGKPGVVMSATFELDGQFFMGLNGGPHFKFTPAISMFVNCESQEEVDEYWSKLVAGGEAQRCGWLRDQYGLSWQIIPTDLGKMLRDSDPARAQRVMQAMLQMEKIDIAELSKAYDGN